MAMRCNSSTAESRASVAMASDEVAAASLRLAIRDCKSIAAPIAQNIPHAKTLALSLASAIERPTAIVFDLDPGAPADVLDCAQVAVWIRGMFEQLGLNCYPKTSGSKGMQIYLPLNTPVTYEETKPFSRADSHELRNR